MAYEIKVRHLSEVDAFAGYSIKEGDSLRVEPRRIQALRQNPFNWGEDPIIQVVGFVDGQVAGWDYIFPIEVMLDSSIYSVVTGSSLNVTPRARKSGLGLALPGKGFDEASKDGLVIGASISQMGIPVHEFNDFHFFYMPRFVMLWKSRALVERRIGGVVGRFIQIFVDCLINVYALVMKVLSGVALRGCQIREIAPDDDEALNSVSQIIKDEGCRFEELHDARWFKWHLTCAFSSDGPCRLYGVWRKGELKAFYMVKKRFYASASHRGFKNVWLGSINEWGCRADDRGLIKWVIVHAALALKSIGCDACEFAVQEVWLQRFMRRLGWRQVGEANVAIKVLPDFKRPDLKDEIFKCENWRLRPAMGDSALS